MRLISYSSHSRFLNDMSDPSTDAESFVRNIVIIGRTGFGEVTIANHIAGQKIEFSPRDSSLMVCGVHEEDDVVYNINILDMTQLSSGGLAQRYPPKISEVHHVLFVLKNEPFSTEDKKMFDDIFQHLDPCVKHISALVIIGCEGIDDRARRRIVEEFSEESQTNHVAEFVRKNINAVGFVDLSDIIEQIRPVYEDGMKVDEKLLRDMVMKRNEPVDVVFKSNEREKIAESIAEPEAQGPMTLESFANKLKIIEEQQQNQQREIEEHKKLIQEQQRVIQEFMQKQQAETQEQAQTCTGTSTTAEAQTLEAQTLEAQTPEQAQTHQITTNVDGMKPTSTVE